jgi:hypothetical protein
LRKGVFPERGVDHRLVGLARCVGAFAKRIEPSSIE